MQLHANALTGAVAADNFCCYPGTANQPKLRLTLVKKTLRVMQLTAILLTVCCLTVTARTVSQTVSYTGSNVKLETVFEVIEKQTGYFIFYEQGLLDNAKTVSVNADELPLKDFLTVVLKDQPFNYSLKNTTVVIEKKKITEILSGELNAPPVSGIVKGPDGRPLAGVNIVVKGTKKGVTSNEDGIFMIESNSGDVLILSAIGYATKEVLVSANNLGIILLAITESKLDEVQIIAYGTTTKRFNTGNVATVKASDIEKQPVNNPLLALIGRVPGVVISQTSGVAGSGINLQMQGKNSLANGGEAFYVIDGVPFQPQGLYTGINGGAFPASGNGQGSNLNFLSPGDIESVEFLKDADATAIYGSRAGNGAILITTKKGRAGETKVNLNMQAGWGKITKKVDLMNTEQYLAMRKEAFKNNNNATIGATDYDVNGTWDQNRDVNWQNKLVGGTAKNTNIQASISGGNKQTQFLAGGAYSRETTVYPADFADVKANAHFNLTHTSSNQKFRFDLTSSYLEDLNKLGLTDLTSFAIVLSPNSPELYNDDGSINWEIHDDNATFTKNPAAKLLSKYSAKTNSLISSSILSYEIIPGLRIKTSLGYNNQQTKELSTTPQASFDPGLAIYNFRSASYGNKLISSWIIEPQASYNREFNFGDIDVLLGSTFQSSTNSIEAFNGSVYPNDSQLENSLAAGEITPNSNNMKTQYRYNAIFGRLNYRLNDRYIINLSARRDGSSRFGSENLFHSFYAVGGAWIFREERWLKSAFKGLSFGKLRMTYGTTGNDQIKDYQYLNLYNNYTDNIIAPYQQSTGLLPTGHSNPFIQWEETRKLNIGIDLGFLNNRIMVTGDYYRNRSSNQLLGYNLPVFTGFGSVLRNIPALVQNSGFEFILEGTLIQSKNVKWQSSLNFTLPKSILLKYPNFEESSASYDYIIGESPNIVKVFEFAGVNKETGLYEFRTYDGKLTSSPDALLDKTKFITRGQTFYGGFSNNFSLKNFQLSVLFQFVKQMAQNYKFGSQWPGVNSNQPIDVLERWQQVGDVKDVQKFSNNFSALFPYLKARESDAYYSDASFIRLKNVSLSYSVPSKWLRKLNISNAGIFVQGQNLVTFTKFKWGDPEIANPGILPPLKVISTGLQLTF